MGKNYKKIIEKGFRGRRESLVKFREKVVVIDVCKFYVCMCKEFLYV